MLSTLPLFYIAQSVNSDDRRARFQGLWVIMNCPFKLEIVLKQLARLLGPLEQTTNSCTLNHPISDQES